MKKSTKPKVFNPAISNAKFRKLGKRAQRVAVAKDALQQLDLGRYKATRNAYMIFNTESPEYEDLAGAKEFLTSNKARCSVCAKGALVCSAVRIINERKLSGMSENDAEIIKIFGDMMWNEIELMFMGWPLRSWMLCKYGAAIQPNSLVWYYIRKKTPMKDILENIIKNKGRLLTQHGKLLG